MAKEQENDLDSLAQMVAGGFKEVGQQFREFREEVDKRFDELANEMIGRFDAVDKRFDTLEKDVRQVNQRIDKVVIPELDAHATRIKDLEVHTGIHA